MQRLFFSLCLFFCLGCTTGSPAQPAESAEFGQSENGLIYGPKTIQQLRYIVDSLNLKFKVCEANPVYHSISQTSGHYVSMSGPDCKKARKDLEGGMSLLDFVMKYRKVTVYKDLAITKGRYKNYEEKDVFCFEGTGIHLDNDLSLEFDNDACYANKKLGGKWIVDFQKGEEEDYLQAFYITKDFTEQKIPQDYARWIQYADCLVDTTARIFLESAKRQYYVDYTKDAPAMSEFLERMKKPADSLSEKELGALRPFAMKAYAEAKDKGFSDDVLEAFLAKDGMGKAALDLKRSRIVVGSCSQDDSPRRHALNIARLAAETTSWEVFLRAHLDIMNDNFSRMSDGSYAFDRRQTYIRELEVLDINVPDLLFGICVQIAQPGQNHYRGSVSRVGRALAEYSHPKEIEDRMLAMVSDTKLDPYNRMIFYYLFLNYNHYLQDKDRQEANKQKIKAVLDRSPLILTN